MGIFFRFFRLLAAVASKPSPLDTDVGAASHRKLSTADPPSSTHGHPSSYKPEARSLNSSQLFSKKHIVRSLGYASGKAPNKDNVLFRCPPSDCEGHSRVASAEQPHSRRTWWDIRYGDERRALQPAHLPKQWMVENYRLGNRHPAIGQASASLANRVG